MACYGQSIEQHLIEQIHLGENSYRDDLLSQSIEKLERINPEHPEILAVHLRLALKQGNINEAKKILNQLSRIKPHSPQYLNSKMLLSLESPENKMILQQAAQAELNGNKRLAFQYYYSLFHDNPPTFDLSVKYWWTYAAIPGNADKSLAELLKLNTLYPGNGTLQSYISSILYRKGRIEESFSFLKKMASSPGTNSMAATKWLVYIDKLPPGMAKKFALQEFLSVFNTGEMAASAKVLLSKEEHLLSSSNHTEKALAARTYGNQSLFFTDVSSSKKTKSATKPIDYYWKLIKKGNFALKEKRYIDAELFFRKALSLSVNDPSSELGLGLCALGVEDYDKSLYFISRAVRKNDMNKKTLNAMASAYERFSVDAALQWFSNLRKEQRFQLLSYEKRWQVTQLGREAAAFEEKNEWLKAINLHQKRQEIEPDNLWITYRIAMDYRKLKQPKMADKIIGDVYTSSPKSDEQKYIYSMYLVYSDQFTAAQILLDTIPLHIQSDKIIKLKATLKQRMVFKHAYDLRDNNHNEEAISYIRENISGHDVDLFIADAYFKLGKYNESNIVYLKLLTSEVVQVKAIAGLIRIAVATNNYREIVNILNKYSISIVPLDLQLKVAKIMTQNGDYKKAEVIYNSLDNIDNLFAFRDSAKYYKNTGNVSKAKTIYQRAILPSQYKNKYNSDEFITRFTKHASGDDWLSKSIKNDASELYKQQDTVITLGMDDKQSDGTSGYSNTHTATSVLNINTPFSTGKLFTQLDRVSINAGDFSGNKSGKWYQKFGTCKSSGCYGYEHQHAEGVSYATGWKNSLWGWDLGTTPVGFDVIDWSGGITYRENIGLLKMNYSLHRRPLSNSLLSFSGRKDPKTGITWGGVQATGLNINMSYDKGEGNGFWMQLNADNLQGKNVADNKRIRLMSGYYHRLINTSDKQLQFGLSNSIWHYQNNLSGYTLGQGGYYSPQSYISLGAPVNYRQRTDNWSFESGGSIVWSEARTDDSFRYPLQNLIPADLKINDINTVDKGGRSSGVGYSVSVKAERRITPHWFMGASIILKKTDDYSPSHALFYIKYSVDGWEGDMDMPLKEIFPYSEYR